MLDLCYGNMSEAYKAVCRPPLGKSDYNVIHLLPKYKAVVKKMNLMPNKFGGVLRKVGNKLVMCLKTQFGILSWETCEDVHELTNVFTSFIKFCEDFVCGIKTVNIYPHRPFLNNLQPLSMKGKQLLTPW